MKFAAQLEGNSVAEWKEKYINFRMLCSLLPLNPSKRPSSSVEKSESSQLLVNEADEVSISFIGEPPIISQIQEEIEKVEFFYVQKIEDFANQLKTLRGGLDSVTNDRLLDQKTRDKRMYRLKKGFIQLYRACQMLENFASLNYSAIFKISKKCEKRNFHLAAIHTVLEDTKKKQFFEHYDVKSMLNDIETTFADKFVQSKSKNKKKKLNLAKDELNARRHDKRDLDMLIIGGLSGYCFPFFILLIFLIVAHHDIFHNNIHTFIAILPVFRLVFIPTLAVWLWGINVLVFHQSRINHVFILDFKPSSALGFTAIFKLAALLSSIFCLPFFLTYASIGGLVAFQNLDAVKIYPLLLIILNFVLLLIPFVFYSSTRWNLFKSIFEFVISPFGRLTFREFFVGDILTSMVKTISDLEYTLCYYISGSFLLTNGSYCTNFNSFMNPILSMMPLWFRLLQCVKRYFLTGDKIHIINSIKYLFAMSVSLFGNLMGDQAYSPAWSISRIIWAVLFICSTLSMFCWDVLIDWSLGKVSSKNFLLRDKLVWGNHKGFYYYCIISDFFFRFFWAVTISPLPFELGMQSEVLNLFAATIEIIRRFTWSIIRIENEHLNNCDNFRAIDFIPLPFDVNRTDI